MSFHADTSAPFWLPDAVLLSALLLTPRKTWWLFLLAPIPIRFFVDVPPNVPGWFLPAMYVNDSFKAFLGAYILTRLSKGTPKLRTIRELFQFFSVAVILMPFLSAFGGAWARSALGDDFWTAWQIWFLGNALPNLVLTPMILYWSTERIWIPRPAGKWRWLEGIVLFGTISVLGIVESSSALGDLSVSPILMYLPFPLLLYAAARFGPVGVSTAFFIVTAFAMWSADQGLGPFAGHPPDSHLLWIQLVFYAMSVPLLGVAVLLKESNRNEQIARENHRQMQELAARLIHLQDEERRRIAGELHDSLGQSLALIRIRLDKLMTERPTGDIKSEELNDIAAMAARANEELRGIAHNFPIYELDRIGLEHAIESMIQRLADSTPVEIWADLDPINGSLSQVEQTNLFRIVQEGLNNIIKHSNATHASVKLSRSEVDVRLIIEDDGNGMAPLTINGTGVGLSNISERARMIGATLNVDSTLGIGTRLTITLERNSEAGKDHGEAIIGASAKGD